MALVGLTGRKALDDKSWMTAGHNKDGLWMVKLCLECGILDGDMNLPKVFLQN